MNTIVYLLLAAGFVIFGGSTLAAFYWAAKSGQFRNLEDGAKSIFDRDEPLGTATDAFADKKADRPLRRSTDSFAP
ncbi:MAG: cbb3-type cytochrome oxidase assembly protein CcoS [Verrucomicrobia bacterium]|nr:cbb3-type cytochrome oxidase assembly protein CcoS [Verrucomicrobiota bacterium]MDA1202831.1 cbb3-type cytochrome oxidase assembly protein CcoS [Verrucomicrobiota bacterium]